VSPASNFTENKLVLPIQTVVDETVIWQFCDQT
jgi:hypothetical protein